MTARDLAALGVRLYDEHFFCPLSNGTRPRRHLTLGEIGCSLSHYGIWKQVSAPRSCLG